MGVFFIDTDTGQVALLGQLVQAGVTADGASPPAPWHRIQGSSDASTLWYAVLRKKIQRKSSRSGGSGRGAHDSRDGVYIGALAIRHQPHHASLLADGWEDVAVDEIGIRSTGIRDEDRESGDQAM
jgi:hypothetical protein